MAKIEEFEDPTSRYQNPRYSGKSVPDRATNPKRKLSQKTEEYDKQMHSNFDSSYTGYADALMTDIFGTKKQSASARRYMSRKKGK